MKKIFFAQIVMLLFALHGKLLVAQTSPDYIFGDNNGSSWSWTTGTQGSAGLGGSYKWQFQASATIDHTFKFGETSSNADGQGFWMNNAVGTLQYTGTGAVSNAYYNSNQGTNGAIYFSITNGKYYVVKARKDPANSNANFSVMELSGAPITISGVTDDFGSSGTAMTVKITLSGTKSSEERIFVKYTIDNWATSAISSEASGSGTSYTATIPAGGVTATANNKYYVFTTTVATPSASDADLMAINYNDNSGYYYQIFSKSVNINIANMEMGFGLGGPWMFNESRPFFQNNASYCVSPYPTAAYKYIEWRTVVGINSDNTCGDCNNQTAGQLAITTTSCTSEQTNVLNNTSDVTLFFNSGTLSLHQHINTVHPGNNWDVEGEAGDFRIYSGTGGYLKVGGVTKLAFSDFWFNATVSYPTPYGADSPSTVDGWAIIDRAGSDPVWVDEFDPYGTGHVVIQGSTLSSIIQLCYGQYNWNISLTPSTYQSFIYSSHTPAVGVDLNFGSGRVSFNFSDKTGGGRYSTLDTVTVKYIKTTPSGSLPVGINRISPVYWQLGTVLSSYTANVTFDLADIGGITTQSDLRILKRENSSSAWAVVAGYDFPDATHIRATTVTSFSEWTIGTTGSDLLPVELTSFTAKTSNGSVVLDWITATETNNYGFEIERQTLKNSSSTGGKEDFIKIGFVNGSGTSNSTKKYSFTDNSVISGKYQYRLKQIDNSGEFKYSQIVEVDLNNIPDRFSLAQNYPNPFNPSTVIKYDVPVESKVKIVVFNSLGQELMILMNGIESAGQKQVTLSSMDGLSSGVYYYRIEIFPVDGSRSFSQTKKMVLLR